MKYCLNVLMHWLRLVLILEMILGTFCSPAIAMDPSPVLALQSGSPPVVSAGDDAWITEGDTFLGVGSFTDPDSYTWTATVNYGDVSGVQPLTLTDKTFHLDYTYTEGGYYYVTVTVTDDGGEIGFDTLFVNVNNVALVIPLGKYAPRSEVPLNDS